VAMRRRRSEPPPAGSLASVSCHIEPYTPLSQRGTKALAVRVPPLPAGHSGARTARSEKCGRAARSRSQSAAEGDRG
jgi:hypothetical protein